MPSSRHRSPRSCCGTSPLPSPRSGSAAKAATCTSSTWAAGRVAAGVRRGSGASSCRLARSRMPSTDSCRASSAASGSTSASSSSRGRSTIWPRAPGSTNGVPRRSGRELDLGHGAGATGRPRASRRRRRHSRADRAARHDCALPLAGRSVEHDHPAVGGAHRPLRRSRRRAEEALRVARHGLTTTRDAASAPLAPKSAAGVTLAGDVHTVTGRPFVSSSSAG